MAAVPSALREVIRGTLSVVQRRAEV